MPANATENESSGITTFAGVLGVLAIAIAVFRTRGQNQKQATA
jgi:hypothetical protein